MWHNEYNGLLVIHLIPFFPIFLTSQGKNFGEFPASHKRWKKLRLTTIFFSDIILVCLLLFCIIIIPLPRKILRHLNLTIIYSIIFLRILMLVYQLFMFRFVQMENLNK